jgi:hypothetical protein
MMGWGRRRRPGGQIGRVMVGGVLGGVNSDLFEIKGLLPIYRRSMCEKE